MARAGNVPQRLLVEEAASALVGFSADRLGLVTACRRVVQRHRSSGALVYLAASALVAAEPVARIQSVVTEINDDPSADVLVRHLDPEARVLVVDWPEEVPRGFGRRGDLTVVAVDITGEGDALADALMAADVAARAVASERLGQAVTDVAGSGTGTGVVVLEALAMGPAMAATPLGSLAAAATARAMGVAVWMVVPAGRVLSAGMWECFAACSPDCDMVPSGLVDQVIRPDGVHGIDDVARRPDCPDAPELFLAPGL